LSRFFNITLFLLITGGLIASCGPSRVLTEEPAGEPAPEEEELTATSAFLSAEDLSAYRNTLSEPYLISGNRISSVFEISENEFEEVDTRSGYRIQLISTDDMEEAEDVSMEYYDWAINRELPYEALPEAYVLFRQPYYRVRIGDFRSRTQAIEFLGLIRRHFQGAWIVIDTIDPDRAPE
jgi:hypothetical protein